MALNQCIDGVCLRDGLLDILMCLAAGKLAHSLRLGAERRVGRYLCLQFSGHLTPEAQSGESCHTVATTLSSEHCHICICGNADSYC